MGRQRTRASSGRNVSPTIVDVAREAGVSVSTVSRVLNNKPDVAQATREAVRAAIRRLGYVANPSARRLAGGRTGIIGLVVPDFITPYAMEIARGVGEAVREASYDLILYSAGQGRENHRGEEREHAWLNILSRGLVDGLLLVLPRSSGEALISLAHRGFPVVLIDHRGIDTDLPSVVATNREGALEATRYLLSLGHRRIGFITGLLNYHAGADRLAGYREALAQAGVPYDPSLVIEGNFRRQSGYEAALALMRLPDPPTAIFASNDESALGALDALRDLGLRVPDDVSLVGFDDISAAAETRPPLTTVRQPLMEMGYQAVQLILAMLNGRSDVMQQIQLPTRLIVRGSCSPLQSPQEH
ncbi:MAG TPA: LacI family transcriptional regulator [Caldilineae bacterium]|nr:LacI family transcriptional regulator [Caldilineae bacterium]